jgi:hypothetical protein
MLPSAAAAEAEAAAAAAAAAEAEAGGVAVETISDLPTIGDDLTADDLLTDLTPDESAVAAFTSVVVVMFWDLVWYAGCAVALLLLTVVLLWIAKELAMGMCTIEKRLDGKVVVITGMRGNS